MKFCDHEFFKMHYETKKMHIPKLRIFPTLRNTCIRTLTKEFKLKILNKDIKNFLEAKVFYSSCQCKICDKIFVHHRMIKHIERTHKQGSKDKFTFLKLSYYR